MLLSPVASNAIGESQKKHEQTAGHTSTKLKKYLTDSVHVMNNSSKQIDIFTCLSPQFASGRQNIICVKNFNMKSSVRDNGGSHLCDRKEVLLNEDKNIERLSSRSIDTTLDNVSLDLTSTPKCRKRRWMPLSRNRMRQPNLVLVKVDEHICPRLPNTHPCSVSSDVIQGGYVVNVNAVSCVAAFLQSERRPRLHLDSAR